MWLRFHKEKCTGCGACIVACMDEHNRTVIGRYCSLYEHEYFEKGHLAVDYYVVACQHCEAAACAQVCPKQCFSRDEQTKLVILNQAECIGCGRCERSCKFHAVRIFADKKAEKCNGCIELLRKGQTQRCAEDCRVGAFTAEAAKPSEHAAYTNSLYQAILNLTEKGVR